MPNQISVVEEIKSQINETNFREAYELVLRTLRKKMQEKVLQLIDSPRGEVDLELEELMQLSEKHGLNDEKELLERYSFETLRDFLRFKKQKRKRSEKEKRLEDFLMQDANLARVENDLVAVSRQVDIESGVIDIHAKSGDEEVIVELKMRQYQSAKVYPQLMKYMNETKKRIVFVAPEIRRDLFHELEEQYNAGRIRFVEVKEVEEGKDYSFTEINRNNLTKKGKERIDWTKIKKRNGEVTKVRLFNGGRVVRDENKDTILAADATDTIFAGGEEIPKGSFALRSKPPTRINPDEETLEQFIANAPNYPMYYNMMVVYGIAEKNSRKYLQARKVLSKQKQALIDLLESKELEKNLSHHKKMTQAGSGLIRRERAKSDGTYCVDIAGCTEGDLAVIKKVNEFEHKKRSEFSQTIETICDHLHYPKNCDYRMEIGNDSDESIDNVINSDRSKIAETWRTMSLEQRLGVLDKWNENLQKRINELDSGKSEESRLITSYFGLINRICADYPEEEREYAKEGLKFRYARIFNELLKLKLKRTKKLLEIDENLAESYLTFSIPSEHYLNQLLNKPSLKTVIFDTELINNYAEKDRQVYESILEKLVAEDESRKVDLSKLKDKPLFYQVMAKRGCDERELQRFDRGIKTGIKQIARLRKLEHSICLEVRDMDDVLYESIRSQIEKISIPLPSEEYARLTRAVNRISDAETRANEELARIVQNSENRGLEKQAKAILDYQRRLTDLESSLEEDMKLVLKAEEKIVKELTGSEEKTKEYFKARRPFIAERIIAEFQRIKNLRIGELRKINEELAVAYLHYPSTEDLNKKSRGLVTAKYDILESQRFYESILENLVDEEIEQNSRRNLNSNVDKVRVNKINNAGTNGNGTRNGNGNGTKNGNGNGNGTDHGELTQDQKLVRAITDRSYDHYDSAKQARVRAFVDEEISQYSVDLDQLRKSFYHSKLGQRIREHPSDYAVITFFDDIKLRYLMQGKVPTSQQLIELYEENCGTNETNEGSK